MVCAISRQNKERDASPHLRRLLSLDLGSAFLIYYFHSTYFNSWVCLCRQVIDPFESSDPSRWPDEDTRHQMIHECRGSSAGPFLLVNKVLGENLKCKPTGSQTDPYFSVQWMMTCSKGHQHLAMSCSQSFIVEFYQFLVLWTLKIKAFYPFWSMLDFAKSSTPCYVCSPF